MNNSSNFIEELFGAILAAVFVVATLLFTVSISTIMGAATGWVVGLVFEHHIFRVVESFVDGFSMYHVRLWQIGATLGFISGFFRKTTIVKESA